MKNYFILVCLFLFILSGYTQEVVISGSQESLIKYRLEQSIVPFDGIDILMVSFVVPQNFVSPTYNQEVSDVKFTFSPEPLKQEEETDARGNRVRKFYWEAPAGNVKCDVSLTADNQVRLRSLQSKTPFPLKSVPEAARAFLQATAQVQAENPKMKAKAAELIAGKETEIAAVQAILHYVVDNMRYVLVPQQYDALYAFESGRGNCQNYSHLAAALMRSAGIPVRIVNGITLKKAYGIQMGEAEYSFEMAQGRHSWVEVYFPDAGWIPFDPQQTEFFVSNRYLRIEVGLDNEETVQDGLVRWSQSSGSAELTPQLEEAIESDFVTDRVALLSEKELGGPKRLLLTPELVALTPAGVAAPLQPEPVPEAEAETEPEPEPEKAPEGQPEAAPEPEVDFMKLTYDRPFETGNLEFPRQFDFVSARLEERGTGGGKNELRRNFIVETAEYVTGKAQFAQTFELDEPLLLQKIGLALHNFGGSGFLWLEVSEDDDGRPGQAAARSKRIPNSYIRIPKGYDWVDFDLSGEGLLLTPGRYWFTLHYSGSPIVNWFYSYGKPVGPVDGTRSKTGGANAWDKILSFEFNYRVRGLAASD